MAEFVEFRAEEWISELEEMERIRLFEEKEIRCIATRRKEFEYKIQRRTKSKEDFLKFIQYELDLYRIIRARRRKRRIKTKRAEIDFSQTHRIANLFKQVIFKFQDDVKLWMSFFKFCKEVKFHSLVSQMLVRMLQIHTNKPDLWVFASNWELEQCGSVVNARQFLTRGLRHHPSSQQLYEELFTLEIKHLKEEQREIEIMEEKNKQQVPDETTKAIIEGRVAEVVYESATKTIPTVDFKASLLQIANKLKAPLKIKNKIFQDMVKKHLNEELTWETIAKRELSGLTCNLKHIVGEESMEVDDDKEKKISLRERIQNSINVYEEAVKRINTVKIWSYYLDHAIKINENKKSLPVFKAKLLQNAMEGAMSSGKMDEKYYLHWVEVLRKSKKIKKQLEVLKRGLEDHPKSVPICHALLRYYFSFGKEEEGMKLFKQTKGDVVPLWKLVVKYLLLKSSPEVEDVFKEGIRRGGDLALALKPDFIEWLAQTKGIEEARRVFESPEMQLPTSLEFYKKMGELEASQPKISAQDVRKCYDQACSRFGKDNPTSHGTHGCLPPVVYMLRQIFTKIIHSNPRLHAQMCLWLDYIKFEMKQDVRNVNQIHRRAVKALSPEKADEFISEYNKFKIGIAA